jgi:peptidyl-tRNA hydrolase, PTH1 family
MDNQPENHTYILVGLGNPGREYRANRHNFGFMVVDSLSKELAIRLGRLQSRALVGNGAYSGKKVILSKPQTFMNLSGQSVRSLVKYYKIPLSNLLVIHDDLDLPFGTLRIRPGGGSGGQRGLASTIEQLGTQDFPRLRLGIGRPPGRMEAADYVLEDFTGSEEVISKQVIEQARLAALTFVVEGLSTAMNKFNGSITRETASDH